MNVFDKRFIEKIKRDKEVIAMLIFGSYARGENHKDVDICLVLSKKYSNKEMTNKRIKYYSDISSRFDIQIFQQLPVYIKVKILKEGKVVLCKNEDRLYEIAYDTIKEYDDFKEIYTSYIKNALK